MTPPAPSGDLTQGPCWEESLSDPLGAPHSHGPWGAPSGKPVPGLRSGGSTGATVPSGGCQCGPATGWAGASGSPGPRAGVCRSLLSETLTLGVSAGPPAPLPVSFSRTLRRQLALPSGSPHGSGCCSLTVIALAVGVPAFLEASPGREPPLHPRGPLLSEAQQIRSPLFQSCTLGRTGPLCVLTE